VIKLLDVLTAIGGYRIFAMAINVRRAARPEHDGSALPSPPALTRMTATKPSPRNDRGTLGACRH
jgi:hypothetical protein